MGFSSIACFKDLDQQQQAKLRKISTQERIPGGTILIHEGAPSDSVFFVISGRFSITISSHRRPLAEIAPGQTVGEIGFLSGEPRTATATAIRDSIVMKLARGDFDTLCAQFPEILKGISLSLARNLVTTTNSHRYNGYAAPRTLAICPAGSGRIDPLFLEKLQEALSGWGRCTSLNYQDIQQQFPGKAIGSEQITHWLNQQENDNQFVIYVAEHKASEWSAASVRQADLILLVASVDDAGTDTRKLNPCEKLAQSRHAVESQHLVLLHNQFSAITSTTDWLHERDVAMHHHVVIGDSGHISRLTRFITGTAIGLVASGGGAYSAAHIGYFRAFNDAGITFDMIGGASGGAAISAGLAAGGVSNEEMSERIEEVFVRGGALKKLTIPLFSLLDHTCFDTCLKQQYRDLQIEDLWTNFYAISTDLSDGEEIIHRRGPLWHAIRASCSIPGLLPPVTTEDGKVLVDGGIIDNVPLSCMKQLKHGPNIVLCFEPKHQTRLHADYNALPNRKQLLMKLLNPTPSGRLPNAPRITSVLTQCMLLNNSSLDMAGEQDLIVKTSLPKDVRLNDWHRHREISRIGYEKALNWLDRQKDNETLNQIKQLQA